MAEILSGTGLRRAFCVFLAFLAAMLAGAAPLFAQERWAGAWGYATTPRIPGVDPLQPPGTYFHRVKLTQRGNAIMLTLSNTEGLAPATVTVVGIAAAVGTTGFEFNPTTLRQFFFNGQPNITLPIGVSVLTDPLPYSTDVGQEFIISVTFTTPTLPPWNPIGLPVAFAPSVGNGIGPIKTMQVRPYLAQISVREPAARCTVVAFGDSITDGYLGFSPTVRGWPGRLAERMALLPPERRCGVVNMGIQGNRLLSRGNGILGLDRFWRDVASVPGATHVVLLEGINDIGWAGTSAPDLINGYRQFITRARSLGLRVIAGTMTPAGGSSLIGGDKDMTRNQVNEFIRFSGAFDGVIDFDVAVRNPYATTWLRPDSDSGDHLHPNDNGYRLMGDEVNLNLFAPMP
ncbi:SGNH/GDSL hydrolase family protein [Methylobacterium marchantiae]|uniref:SGNH/GDSL hydrolase family protein n=1 Tax=Methylobacterium marchantiae TaxID=600331 RepID=A0ABW3X245_9HYPH|nr:hypothetical protein AIGOOFII_1712 [Methylobacterium marchantiae]